MKLLLIGGSYFLGRVFALEAEKAGHEVSVFNRGSRPLGKSGIREFKGDRHEVSSLAVTGEETFDAVIDFCAYQEGDIEKVFSGIGRRAGQYIFVSTADVYRRQVGYIKDESTPFEERRISGMAGEYISGKVALEKELVNCSIRWGVPYTSVRPVMIYGPYNYAPRESLFARLAAEDCPVPYPADASGRWQFIYVKDAVLMMLALCGNSEAYGSAFNLCDS